MADDNSPTTFNAQRFGRFHSSFNEADMLRKTEKELLKMAGRGNDMGNLNWFADGSDSYANMGFVVDFEHVPSGEQISFKAFISTLNENYNSDWASETVYGRTDAIHMFKNTSRSLTVELKIPAATEGEGFENLGKVQQLVQFLYPVYNALDVGGESTVDTIAQSPLIRLKIMNMFASRARTVENESAAEEAENRLFDPESNLGTYRDFRASGGQGWSQGLLGVLKGLSINHNIATPEVGVFEMSHGTIIPKLIDINFEFDVIHEHVLGWDQSGKFKEKYFPYGVNLAGSKAKTQKELYNEMGKTLMGWINAGNKQRLEDKKKEPSQQTKENSEAKLGKTMGKALSTRKKRGQKAFAKVTEAAGFGKEAGEEDYWKLKKVEE